MLEQHEPDHPLLMEAYRQATHTFLDAESAYRFLDDVQDFDWKLRELPVVSPFSFAIYASMIKENMMLEDPDGGDRTNLSRDVCARWRA